MVEMNVSPEERERKFEEFIVKEYLKYGSVDAVFSRNNYDLPISYPGVHRVINKWGIIKSTGPNSKLSEMVCFLTCLSKEKVPIEKMYRMMPLSFKTSLATMHRVVHNVKEGVVRRFGTALIISPEENNELVLIGNDISTPRVEYGKPFGSISLPMTFSKNEEPKKNSILRVLQQEVFTENVINQNFPNEVVPTNPKPFMLIDIADVRVNVFNLLIKKEIFRNLKFSSFKLENLRFAHFLDLAYPNGNGDLLRAGIIDIVQGYQKLLERRDNSLTLAENPFYTVSNINLELAQLPFEK